jgi:hypothetical protein
VEGNGVSPNEHERVVAAWSQPDVPPAPKDSGARFDWPHPHRPFLAESDLDPTARLEWLDDLMFAAIDGDPVALDYAADAWHKTRTELGETAIEESPITRRTKSSPRSKSSRCWPTSRASLLQFVGWATPTITSANFHPLLWTSTMQVLSGVGSRSVAQNSSTYLCATDADGSFRGWDRSPRQREHRTFFDVFQMSKSPPT